VQGRRHLRPARPIVVRGLNYNDLLVQTRLNGEVRQSSAPGISSSTSRPSSATSPVRDALPGGIIYTAHGRDQGDGCRRRGRDRGGGRRRPSHRSCSAHDRPGAQFGHYLFDSCCAGGSGRDARAGCGLRRRRTSCTLREASTCTPATPIPAPSRTCEASRRPRTRAAGLQLHVEPWRRCRSVRVHRRRHAVPSALCARRGCHFHRCPTRCRTLVRSCCSAARVVDSAWSRACAPSGAATAAGRIGTLSRGRTHAARDHGAPGGELVDPLRRRSCRTTVHDDVGASQAGLMPTPCAWCLCLVPGALCCQLALHLAATLKTRFRPTAPARSSVAGTGSGGAACRESWRDRNIL